MSNRVVAGVLNQLQDDGTWKLVAFFLKIISPIEMRYKIYNKEILVVIRGL
jgi:RNase H-like domain found in reverse transcriptase